MVTPEEGAGGSGGPAAAAAALICEACGVGPLAQQLPSLALAGKAHELGHRRSGRFHSLIQSLIHHCSISDPGFFLDRQVAVPDIGLERLGLWWQLGATAWPG